MCIHYHALVHYISLNETVQDHHIQPQAWSGESWTHHPTYLFGNQEPSRQLLHRFHWALQLNSIQGQETSLSIGSGKVDSKLTKVYCVRAPFFFFLMLGKLETVMFGLSGVQRELNMARHLFRLWLCSSSCHQEKTQNAFRYSDLAILVRTFLYYSVNMKYLFTGSKAICIVFFKDEL